jgi:hypothetical protein
MPKLSIVEPSMHDSARLIDRRAAMSKALLEPVDQTGYTLRLEKIGYHMYYGGNGTYLYQPIAKCACSTIKTLLLRLEGLPVDDNIWRRHQKESFPALIS